MVDTAGPGLPFFLDRMIWSGPATGLVPPPLAPKFREDVHAHHTATGLAGPDVVRLQCLHDLRLVRASEVQGQLAASRYSGELGDRVLRILAGGPRQSLGQSGVHRGATQDHAGGDYADRVRRVFGFVSQRAVGMESRARICINRARRVFYFPQMVVTSWRGARRIISRSLSSGRLRPDRLAGGEDVLR